jgi:regulator of protease activity HflC (stomatin/prohibitin superfamily)
MNIATLVGGIATLSWMVVIGLIVLVVLRTARGKPLKGGGPIIIIAAVLAIIFSSASAGVVFISPEERGVVISAVAAKGYREAPLTPGLNWIIPFAETVVRYPISKQTYTMSIAANEGAVQGDDSIAARTADGQSVLVDASVIFSIDPTKVVQLHITWQDRYGDGLVRAQSRGIIRDVVSQYTIEQVNTSKRTEMTIKIRDIMAGKLSDNGLILDDYILRNIAFSPEYAASVEQKQIAEQQAQQAKLVVEQKKQEAEQARQVAQGRADAVIIDSKGNAQARLINAEAEAKSLDLIATALRDKPELLNYQYITKLSPNIQTMLLPSNAPFLLPVPELLKNEAVITTP